jgi:hypothetical protein
VRRGREIAAAVALLGILTAAAALAADSTSTGSAAPPESGTVSKPKASPPESSASSEAKASAPSTGAAAEPPARATPAPAQTQTQTQTQPAPAAVRPAAAKRSEPSAGSPIARTASAARKPVVAPVARKPATRPAAASPGIVQVTLPAIPQEERVTYHYNALGRRDPFLSLVGGFVGMDEGGDAPPDVGGIKVVGIVWGASDKFALVEDPRGNSLVLRQGDKVMNGVVEALKRDAVVVKLNTEGATQSITIPVTRKGESNAQN